MQKKQKHESEETIRQATSAPSSSGQTQATNLTFASDRNQSSTTSTANTTKMTTNLKCPLCEKPLDGSFRTMTHAVCGLRFCGIHLTQFAQSITQCPRCNREILKEDLMNVPSLSSSQRVTHESTKDTESTQAHRMKLLSTLGGGVSDSGSKTSHSTELLYECPICNLGSLPHAKLLEHSKMHTNIAGKCPICATKYGRDYFSKHLYGHLMLRHKEQQNTTVSTSKKIIDTVDQLPASIGVGGKQNSTRYSIQNQIQLQASKGAQTSTIKKPTQIQVYAQKAGSQKPSSTQPKQTNSAAAVIQDTANVQHNLPKQSVLSNMMLLQTQNYNSSNRVLQLAKKKSKESRGQSLSSVLSQGQLISKNASAVQQNPAAKPSRAVPRPPALQMNQEKKTLAFKDEWVQKMKKQLNVVSPFQTNTHLTQGLLGIYTFSIVSADGESKRKLQLTSKYTSASHKVSLLKRQSPVQIEPFKLTNLEKFLRSQEHIQNQGSQDSCHTDDGISSNSSQEQNEDTQSWSLEADGSHPKKNKKRSEKTEDFILGSQQELQKDRGKKNSSKLQTPLYLEEIQRICFPFEKLPSKKVIFQKNAAPSSPNKIIFSDSNSKTKRQSQAQQFGMVSPELAPRTVAQSPHQNYYYSSSNKKFSFSPTNQNYRSSVKVKQPMRESVAPGQTDEDAEANRQVLIRQSSLPRFKPNSNVPQMTLFKAGRSPQGHHGTNQIPELSFREYKPCTYEDIEKFHKVVFYSTRTSDDKLHYLSILVCAQPTLKEQAKNGDNQDLSDVIISDEDEEDSTKGIRASLEPFVLVIVTSKPLFESSFGSQMLKLIYEHCFRPLYRRISFPSPMLTKSVSLSQKEINEYIPLETAVSLLFDVMNIFFACKEDSYRRLNWKDPLANESISMLQVNQIFLGGVSNLFLNCNQSFRKLRELVQVDDIIKLYSCMLLEKKIVLVGNDRTFQEQLAPLIEALLSLFSPLDSQVFSNVSYCLSEEMVFYMEKPGSIIMGMPQHIWTSHGKKVFEQSFDNYIVVFELDTEVFHLKTDNEAIGLPRTFSKLLRRSIAAIDMRQSEIYTSFQFKQAFFNVLILLISRVKSQEAKRAEKRFKAQTLNSLGGKQDLEMLSDNSSNSVQSVRGGKIQYPQSNEFLQEFKQTTTFIDLSDKLEKKESSVSFIAECLEIIEKQKIDWFLKLLEYQTFKVGPDIVYLAKLFCPQEAQSPHVDGLKEFNLQEIFRVYNESLPDSKKKTIASFADQFKVKKRLVSKTLRTNLLELKSNERGQRFVNKPEYGANAINFVRQNQDGSGVAALGSFGPSHKSLSNLPVQKQANFTSKHKSSELSSQTSRNSFPSARKGMQEARAPQTPDGLAVRNFIFGDVEPLSPSRAPRYSSTQKPQIEFRQVRSSSQKKKERSPDAVDFIEESKVGKEPQAKPSTGGFFSMITNFFSSNPKGAAENVSLPEVKTSATHAKEEPKEFQARKASKSMQVVQPQFMNFQRPMDMKEVAKIKTLSSGLTILQNLWLPQGEFTQLDKNFQFIQPSRQSQSLINNEATQNGFQRPLQNEKNKEKSLDQGNIRQETATFIQSASLAQSASKPQETAQFAFTPHKFKDTHQNSTQRVVLNYADFSVNSREEQLRQQAFSLLHDDAEEIKMTNGALQSQFQNALNSLVQRHVLSRTNPQHSDVAELPASNTSYVSKNLQGMQLNSIDCSGTAMHTFANQNEFQIVVPKNSAAVAKENDKASQNYVSSRYNLSLQTNPVQQSQNGQNERGFLSARSYKEQEIRQMSPTPLVSLANSIKRGVEEKILKVENPKVSNRPSFPFTNYSSPNSTAAMFWSAPHEAPPAEKRFSLNAIRLVQNQPSSKGSANVASSQRFSEVGGQFQKSISAMSSKSGQERVSNNGSITLVRTATINLDQELLAAGRGESNIAPGQQNDFVSIPQKSAIFSSSQSDLMQMKLGNNKLTKDSNTQKLKITISKLQSKQEAVSLRQEGNSTTPHKYQSQIGSNQAISSQVAWQIQHSQSALSFQKLQKQGRNTKQCISPKIVTKLGQVAYQSGIVTEKNAQNPKPSLSLYRNNGSASVVESGKATQKMQLQKNLSQSSQNLKGTQQLKRAQLLTSDVVMQSSSRRDMEQAQDVVFTANHRESLKKKGQATNKQSVLNRFISEDHDNTKGKQTAGVIQASKAHLFSPRRSKSPHNNSFKQRPKTYSHISHAAALPQSSQTYFPQKHVSQTTVSTGNLGFKNKFYADNTNSNQTISLRPIGSLSQPGSTVQLHSQSVQLAPTGPHNEYTGSLLKVTNQKEVLHNILKKGMQRQAASNMIQTTQPGTSLVDKSRSSSKFLSIATLTKHNSDKQKSATLTLSRSQFSEKHSAEGKRNSMTQLADADANKSIAQLPGPSKQPNSRVQQVDLTTSVECHTPSDICLDTIIPSNSRRQQKLTQVAEEKKGDDEHVEMENLQEMLDGYESNRIRSISHQFPSQASFLRASQDKMQIGMPLSEQQHRSEIKDDGANTGFGIKKLLRNE